MKFPCTLKNTLPINRDCFGLSFATKGLGYLAAPYLPLPLLARYQLPCYQTICYLQFQCLQKLPYWKPLVISFCSSLGSTLLLIERTTIDPLYLWVISDDGLLELSFGGNGGGGGRDRGRHGSGDIWGRREEGGSNREKKCKKGIFHYVPALVIIWLCDKRHSAYKAHGFYFWWGWTLLQYISVFDRCEYTIFRNMSKHNTRGTLYSHYDTLRAIFDVAFIRGLGHDLPA